MVGIFESLIGDELHIGAAERVAYSRREIGKRHFVTPAHAGVHLMNLARKAMGREPFLHGARIQKGAIDSLGRGGENTLELNGIGHRILLFWPNHFFNKCREKQMHSFRFNDEGNALNRHFLRTSSENYELWNLDGLSY